MKTEQKFRWLVVVLTGIVPFAGLFAGDPNPGPPTISSVTIATNGQRRLDWTPYPAASEYQVLSGSQVSGPFAPDISGNISGYSWTSSNNVPASFHRLQVTPLSSNALLSATVLHRLTYGPTPEKMERIAAMGPQAYIDEHLLPEGLNETIDTDPPITNAPPPPPPIQWLRATVTGTVPTAAVNTNLILYLSGAGHVYVDDIQLVAGTNADQGTNLISNGDFESGFAPWIATGSFTGSTLESNIVHSGSASLHLIGTAAGASADNGVYQPFATNVPPVTQKFT